MAQVTLYRYEGDEDREPTYRLAPTHPAIDSRAWTLLQAELHGLEYVDDPEHGPILCTPDGLEVWSILNALATGRLTVSTAS